MKTSDLRCWFCRMRNPHSWLGIPVCHICRDQLYDFLWVSLVQVIVWMLGGIDGLFFVIDELLLFFVLIIVKHRVSLPWEQQK
jgi:hypothetical protein